MVFADASGQPRGATAGHSGLSKLVHSLAGVLVWQLVGSTAVYLFVHLADTIGLLPASSNAFPVVLLANVVLLSLKLRCLGTNESTPTAHSDTVVDPVDDDGMCVLCVLCVCVCCV